MRPSPRQPWRINIQTLGALFALSFSVWLAITQARLIFEVLWVLFGALLITLALRPLAAILAKKHIPRGVTVIGAYLLMGGILASIATLLVPQVNSDVAALQANGPDLLQTAISRLHSLAFIGSWLSSNVSLAQNLSQQLDQVASTLVTAAANVGSVALEVIIALVLAYFFVSDEHLNMDELLQKWAPASYHSRARLVLRQLSTRLSRWVWAQGAIGLYFAAATTIGLLIIGVPFAFSIGLVSGLLEIVPYLGGAVGLILALLSALAANPTLALWVILLYILVLEAEGHIIAPIFYGRVMGLHPAAILLALFIGFKLGGVIGVFLAVPTAVVVISLVEELQRVYIGEGTEVPADE
jgi:predicted PurR-regulated permease PerM